MTQANKEYRNYSSEIRSLGEDGTVDGYAFLFDVESKVLRSESGGYFNEIIDRSAIDQDIINKSDVLCFLNHDENRGLLARSKYGKGSLKLEIDDKGLRYSFKIPNTSLGNELRENLNRGDVTESSFAFTIEKENTIQRSDNKYPLRKILKFFRLYDVSPVYTPAYEGTLVSCRSIDDFYKDEEEKRKESEKEAELEEYFKKLKEQL